MRIIAGEYRGRRLASVGKGDPGAHLRPTTDRVRESLFNTLAGGRFGDPISGARVLDLFAGTGALGLEALSRGAEHVTLVDDGRAAGKLIRENIQTLGCKAACKVIARDATRLPQADTACGLIFLDPPYGKDLGGQALAVAQAGGWIAPEALIVWEEEAAQEAPAGFNLLDHKRYGDTWISFLQVQ
ncbi:16S rRNA (guanine(966)-N(2))-methyltransferase RsmD [Pelagimonas varians]|uniref:Ribosomal RNA small subunit methyltransferase D n=1 Tax=Pelagimonas varians TaxID=696760 RepID=A0A238KLT6_9RHOB|nr:16S rRNA (guanine(966)-N(2))-methyltransferase RsmD [Pelagimonas varians]PYG29106.1 16S rRNA (guanine966-N2)-methyltransferase [Pelagimonas varians]SMX43751.1 Ribosomal RNA small subunit methyltransferase D [Pelagimonas varians]